MCLWLKIETIKRAEKKTWSSVSVWRPSGYAYGKETYDVSLPLLTIGLSQDLYRTQLTRRTFQGLFCYLEFVEIYVFFKIFSCIYTYTDF